MTSFISSGGSARRGEAMVATTSTESSAADVISFAAGRESARSLASCSSRSFCLALAMASLFAAAAASEAFFESSAAFACSRAFCRFASSSDFLCAACAAGEAAGVGRFAPALDQGVRPDGVAGGSGGKEGLAGDQGTGAAAAPAVAAPEPTGSHKSSPGSTRGASHGIFQPVRGGRSPCELLLAQTCEPPSSFPNHQPQNSAPSLSSQ
mmetsp:Transcript_143539/g.459046  ORF Transcript_143539/g.459046 Transcript_143539/m.459046 type:complete len:209 (-) Transcript_143539:742-1368(-)